MMALAQLLPSIGPYCQKRREFLQGGRRKIVADEQRRCVGSQMAQQMVALSKLNNSRKL